MWRTLRPFSQADPELINSVADLSRSTTRTLIFTVAGLCLAGYFAVVVLWPFDWRVWEVTLAVLAACGLSWLLLSRWLRVSQVVLQAGLLATLTLAFRLFGVPEIALFLALCPLIAVILMDWAVGLLVEAFVIGWVVWLAPVLVAPLPPALTAITIVVGIVGGLMGWAAILPLYTVVHWSAYNFAVAQKNMEEARQHRAQMARALKDLDTAYYRLERTNAALVAAWNAAEEAERFKTEFVANVSHELRTPLNLIVGFSEVMMMAPESYAGVQLPGPYRRDLNAIYHSAQHLLALVDDVLDLARIEVGKLALKREEVSLEALVAETTAIVRDYITAKGLELRVEVAPDLPPLWIDRLRIRQVLLNLLVNAARFTERGSIVLRVERQGEEVLAKVTDTGNGIPPNDLPKVFDEFRTTEQPASTWHSGTGLGLPISKKFVELHRGRMGVESLFGQGTTFWFTLPCVRASAAEAAVVLAERVPPVDASGGLEQVIIVAHDDPRVAPMLQRYLSDYRLIGVASLAEGAALAAETHALALVKGSVGDELPRPCPVPVIKCPLPSGRRAAMALGALDLLVKPVSAHDLWAAIERIQRPVRRVLIAGHDPELVRLFGRMLNPRIPLQACAEAYTSEEALRLMLTQKPDLALLDLELPKVEGRSVLEQMAALPELADVPVIAVSTDNTEHLSGPPLDPIEIARPEGFQLAEVAQMLGLALNALAPNWRRLGSMELGLAAKPAASPASADSPPPPAS